MQRYLPMVEQFVLVFVHIQVIRLMKAFVDEDRHVKLSDFHLKIDE
jgi:hypothetical protein